MYMNTQRDVYILNFADTLYILHLVPSPSATRIIIRVADDECVW